MAYGKVTANLFGCTEQAQQGQIMVSTPKLSPVTLYLGFPGRPGSARRSWVGTLRAALRERERNSCGSMENLHRIRAAVDSERKRVRAESTTSEAVCCCAGHGTDVDCSVPQNAALGASNSTTHLRFIRAFTLDVLRRARAYREHITAFRFRGVQQSKWLDARLLEI